MTKLLGLRRPGLAIFALAAFALAALAGWRGYALHQDRGRRLTSAQTTITQAAVYVASYIARTVDAAELLTRDVHEYIDREGGLAATPRADLQTRLAERVAATSIDDYVLVADAAGRPVAYSGSASGPNAAFADRDWFRAHSVNGADRHLGPEVRSRVRDQVVYTYSEALRDPDGAFAGVVVVGIAPTQPKPTTARAVGEPTAQLWTSEGRLIVSSHMDFDRLGHSLPQPAPFEAPPPGAVGFIPDEGRIVAFSKAAQHPLIATVTLPRDDVLAPWRREVRESLVLLALITLVTAVLAAVAARFAGQDHRARRELERTAAALSAAVAEKEILLREIHHRVKNNLQITSSLIQLQSRNFADPDVRQAFEQTQQRLRSISLVHDVLYHENATARVDMRVYLGELTQEIATSNGADERGVSVAMDIEPVVLSPGQVTPLGLCLAEVLTNAFKHAFPDGRAGAIAVQAREAEGEIELVVRDDGSGYEGEAGRPGSLGLMLISVLARQLGGRFSFANEGGTVFRLAFPKKA